MKKGCRDVAERHQHGRRSGGVENESAGWIVKCDRLPVVVVLSGVEVVERKENHT